MDKLLPQMQENRVVRHSSCIRGREMGRLGRKRCRECVQNAHKADFVDSRLGKALVWRRTTQSSASNPTFWAFFAGAEDATDLQSDKKGRKCGAGGT